MKFNFTIILLCSYSFSFSQTTINGTVKDKRGQPVFAANVYIKSSPQHGVAADLNGNFSIGANLSKDTIIVSFIGYETQKIPLSNIDSAKKLVVTLREGRQTLAEVLITAKDPISERFAVTKITTMDIYLNPVAQGDPLKAITALPASTNADETANPSLRGSGTNRTRVVLNGVPVYNPVRASQLNNQGFFSLFSPSILDKQYVYASNPPLTYGNTSAGLVEIETMKKLTYNELNLSATLANTGFFLSQKIKEKHVFIQAYGNFQFSEAFTGIQDKQLPNIKNFYVKDAGINFHARIGKKYEVNSYTYFIDESFKGQTQILTHRGDVSSSNRRIFTVNNLAYYSQKGVASIKVGFSNAKPTFTFGNTYSGQTINSLYTSLNYRWHVLKNIKLQFGLSYDYQRNIFLDSIPVYYYALSPDAPNYFQKTDIDNHILEAYAYSDWDINDKLTLSSGMRSNIPTTHRKYYFSWQLGVKYSLTPTQSFLLSGGQYHNYSTPNAFVKRYNLLYSYQVALDYTRKIKNILVKAAAYFKNESGETSTYNVFNINKINTFGLELYVEYNFWKHFKLSFSNSFIDQKTTIYNRQYKGEKDFNYLIKSTLQYNNPKLFTLSLTYIGRPGIYYTEITHSVFNRQTNLHEPVFSNDPYHSQFASYNRIDMSCSKYIRLKRNALIVFFSLNNIFDIRNERVALYNMDYSKQHVDFYQFRTAYFGLVWQLNY